MAEVFGLAAGVLQVAGFGAEVSSTLFKCAKRFHNASKEFDEIASQVETTSVSLRRVDSLLKDPTTMALHTQKLYDDTITVSNGCFEVFREIDNYVKSFEPRSSFGKMTVRSKARWLFDSGKVQGLGQVLRRYCDVLHLMISVMAIVEGRRAAFVYRQSRFENQMLTPGIVQRMNCRHWRPTSSFWRYQTRIFLTPIRP
jgi:hypothetical protein